MVKVFQLFGYARRGDIGSFLLHGKTPQAVWRRLTWPVNHDGYLIGVDSPVNVCKKPIDKILGRLAEGEFLTGHLGYNDELLMSIARYGIEPIVITRDPRAVLDSFVHYVLNERRHPLRNEFRHLSVKERYRAALYGRQFRDIELKSLNERCRAMEPWIASSYVYRVRFEDIIGIKGGGTDNTQQSVLLELAELLEVHSNFIRYVANNLYGEGSVTFRRGSIDGWRQSIPENLQSELNHELRGILNSWGYH